MYKLDKLSNGLTLITIDLPHLKSVTSMVAVGAGSRYESIKTNGISHFLEHMFFKGSIKFPSAEQISEMIDGIGAVNNAATSKEFTYYWIKSANQHLELSIDILSSMLKEPLFAEDEVTREKQVVIEEMRMVKDNPQRYIWHLYESLQFGDQPLGWDIIGSEETVHSITRDDLISYVNDLYSVENMVLIFAGNIPKNIKSLAEQYFASLPKRSVYKAQPYKRSVQKDIKINLHYKKTDQSNLILGIEGLPRNDKSEYIARVLATVLGEGSSSRLFTQVRERRGLAYQVLADSDSYTDTGTFAIYAGLKLEKTEEGLEVIKAELEKIKIEKVSDQELKKAKEIIKGRTALRSESTNFLAEYFGIDYALDKKITTFEEEMEKVDKVTAEDLQNLAKKLFQPSNYNLQVIGPFKSAKKFQEILSD